MSPGIAKMLIFQGHLPLLPDGGGHPCAGYPGILKACSGRSILLSSPVGRSTRIRRQSPDKLVRTLEARSAEI
jgi:hypothetical protein